MDAARTAALDALLHVDVEEGYSNLVLDKTLRAYGLRGRDASLASALFYGVLERRIPLDWVLRKFSKTPLEKLSPAVLGILRIALYQILYMDKIPASAAVNEAVNCAKENKKTAKASGFVNGVLRSVLRSGDPMSLLPGEEDPVLAASVRYSCPEWIISMWSRTYSMDVIETMLKDFQEEKKTTIRCCLHKNEPAVLKERLEREGVSAEYHPYLPYALEITGYDHLEDLESFRDGSFTVQDISSMLAGELADPPRGAYVIDVCAAPGGKAIHVAEKLFLKGEDHGYVEARDLTEKKAELIRDNIRRVGLTNIDALCRDASVPDRSSEEKADLVIADLPCSGLGVMGKKADLRYRASQEGTESLVKLQREILSCAQAYVKPGGTLLYSTCTVNPAENEENVRWFLSEYPGFAPDNIRDRLCPQLAECVTEEGLIQLIPGVHKSDGFFIARLIKKRRQER